MCALAVYQDVAIWRQFLQDVNLIAQIFGVIFILAYVIYTYQTFRQIKKQTDYQQDAYLRVCHLILKDYPQSITPSMGTRILVGRSSTITSDFYSLKYINTEIHDKLKGILKPIFNFEDSVFEGNFFTFTFTNYGNSPIKEIRLNLHVIIKNSKSLVDMRMLKESEEHDLEIVIDEILTREDEVTIPIISTASFPIYSLIVTGSYLDVRDKKYVISQLTYSGENVHLQNLQS